MCLYHLWSVLQEPISPPANGRTRIGSQSSDTRCWTCPELLGGVLHRLAGRQGHRAGDLHVAGLPGLAHRRTEVADAVLGLDVELAGGVEVGDEALHAVLRVPDAELARRVQGDHRQAVVGAEAHVPVVLAVAEVGHGAEHGLQAVHAVTHEGHRVAEPLLGGGGPRQEDALLAGQLPLVGGELVDTGDELLLGGTGHG